MYLTGLPKKMGLYWVKSKDMSCPSICFFNAHEDDTVEWYNLLTRRAFKPADDDVYWDIPLTPPSDYCMGGSYSVYGRDKDPLLEEIHED